MASVFKHRAGWTMQFRTPHGWRRKAAPKTWTKTQALAGAHDLERRARAGEVASRDVEQLTLADLCRWWLDTWCKPASHSRELSRLRANVLERPLGALQLRKVTGAAIEGRLREMEAAGAATASVEHLRRTLRTIFNRARKVRLWMENPAAEAAARSMDAAREQKPLRAEEIVAVVDAISEPWKRDLVVAAFYTALRKGELLGLHRADVDLEHGTIRVGRSHERETTKGGHTDTLPIAEPLRPFLVHALAASRGAELLFPGPDGQRRPASTDAVAIVQAALRAAGIVEGYLHLCRRCKARGQPHEERHEDNGDRRCPRCRMRLWPKVIPRAFTFHALRHTAASLLARERVGLPQLQRIMRHRSIDTTMRRYVHLYDDDVRAALAKLPALAPPPEFIEGEVVEVVEERAAAGALVPVLSPLALSVKERGPDAAAKLAESGPLNWRAIQDSNLWPSAPEADALSI